MTCHDPIPTVWVLGDQLTVDGTALASHPPGSCSVLFIESLERARQIPYHPQKLILLWSAMRHFAEDLRKKGYAVDYHESARTFTNALRSHIQDHRPSRIILTETAEYGVAARLAKMIEAHDIATEIAPNRMFLSVQHAFEKRMGNKDTIRMETFYRDMRRQTGLLMNDEGEPEGGQWNFDKENRKPPRKDLFVPPMPGFAPDATTRAVMALVAREFPDHFGKADGFDWPVTHAEAEQLLEHFLDQRLDLFGPYQDAIVAGEPYLYHSRLSAALNVGLLDPLAVCRAVEARYREGQARLASVEGFIRQIIGWREFVYRVYHHHMPGYTERNELGADGSLPDFYWTADTDMFCVRDAVGHVQTYGINHHIQRLMITGNFALIAGISPQAVNEWYWLAYADAYEWVVSPNVIGMALYADGGLLASKPYAASANYINRMSDCCRQCRYNPRQTTGPDACPFNGLYWDFLARNATLLRRNPRMALAYKNWDRKPESEQRDLRAHARAIRERLANQQRL